MDWIKYLEEHTELLITNLGIVPEWAAYFRLLLFIVCLFTLSSIAFVISKRILIPYLYKAFKKTSFSWDDLFADTRAFDNLAHIVPAIFVLLMAPAIFEDFRYMLPLSSSV
jgi:miniconductance mechanosensitive channel